jgi:hypothetical protein
MPVAIFLSHSTRDDATVAPLRAALESYAMWRVRHSSIGRTWWKPRCHAGARRYLHC